VLSGGVAQKRAYADRRTFKCGVEQKRSGSNSCVEARRTVAKARQETKP